MAVESPAAFNQSSTYPAEQSRRAWFSWLKRAASSPGIVSGGLVGSSDLQLSAPVSGMSVNVGTGEALIGGSEGGAQGAYYAYATSTTNLVVAASNVSNPRIDMVCATVSDSGYTEPSGGSGNQWSLQCLTGTATSGATLVNLNGAPTAPLSSLVLGYVLVPAGSSNVTAGNISNVATVAPINPGVVPNGSLAIAKLADPTTGKVVGSSGSAASAVYPPGHEFGYDEITAPVTITATTGATANTVITCGAHTFDGAPVLAKFSAPYIAGGANAILYVVLWDGATQLGQMCANQASSAVGGSGAPGVGFLRFTPSAGSHSFLVKAWVNTGSGGVGAGTNAAADYVPAFIQFTKV